MISILRNVRQINESRSLMQEQGISVANSWRRKLYCFIHLLRYRAIAEPIGLNKSWDIWNTCQLVKRVSLPFDAAIYDMGSYNSEIALALWQAGYRNITAADLNPRGALVRWYWNEIRFRQENFYQTDLPDHSQDLITAISVIEHGYDPALLMQLVSRLLKPGGYLVLTTDYHSEKIHIPEDFRPFSLSHTIFSREELEQLVIEMKSIGLSLVSEPDWSPSEYPIYWEGYKYTFAFLAFKKLSN